MYFLSLFLICTSFLNGLSISGIIYDSESKNPLESVNIIIDELNTGTASDSNGYFQLENLPQGNYNRLFINKFF